ncbi:MAG: hydrolase [Flavobacteriaceae bacterium]|nr:hydrolase [Flavobacteriaceae bacterium]
MIPEKSLVIAVDFDGTIVESAYPKIGKPIMFAFDTLKALKNDGHRLILWTYRGGSLLKEAVDFCKKNGIEFYAVNSSFEGEKLTEKISRKILADIYIDDRNIGGLPDWGEIYQLISNGKPLGEPPVKKGFFSFLKS